MKKEKILITLLIILACIQVASATSVSRLFMCNIEGHPGDLITETITLDSTSPSERIGHWYTHYKRMEGDDEKMEITSWITISPINYTLKSNESKTFAVTIKIPKDAESGLYGANSTDANMKGHSHQRRTYLVFEDTDVSVTEAGGQAVYSGLMIPLSVQVLGKPSPPSAPNPLITAIKENTTPILLAVILILMGIVAVIMLKRRKK